MMQMLSTGRAVTDYVRKHGPAILQVSQPSFVWCFCVLGARVFRSGDTNLVFILVEIDGGYIAQFL